MDAPSPARQPSTHPAPRLATITDRTGIEANVVAHYTSDSLQAHVLAALAARGLDLDRLRTTDLSDFDEFHMGGRAATERFADQFPIATEAHLLDIGCGLGGPARCFAERFGIRVDGVDLTAEFVDVGNDLTRRTGLSDLVTLTCTTAVALPFPADHFDGATLLHVGMNVSDKVGLFAEVGRVVRAGGFFAVWEIMRIPDHPGAEPDYPVPWATSADFSFLATAAQYRAALEAAGFTIEAHTDRRNEAIAFLAHPQPQPQRGADATGGLSLVVGAEWPRRIGNLAQAIHPACLPRRN